MILILFVWLKNSQFNLSYLYLKEPNSNNSFNRKIFTLVNYQPICMINIRE